MPGEDCAQLRVGNETRSWKENSILFFDDSFEHEAWNKCDNERVVLQLVFEHPELRNSGYNLSDVFRTSVH